ncbi:heparan sulfate glucosamine 3-O-sulfotransferase 1-like [Mya arenaria]|uniref:heparan sulfate glucosamine 3-O-sulfotransferase 1-like n=1 Tax=Mya arenaria TaxID=6604 RepID=UPI0022E6EF42|nr:heparan sulfate glucosamine 3-O-sulfotransferase 1-like [Mya arenaria]
MIKKRFYKVVLFSIACMMFLKIWQSKQINTLSPEYMQQYDGSTDTLGSAPYRDVTSREHVPSDSVQMFKEESSKSCVKRFPKAIIPGVAKCGTFALLYFLRKHPQIAARVLTDKEPNFFSRRGSYHERYNELFEFLSEINPEERLLNITSQQWNYSNENGNFKRPSDLDLYREIMPCSYSNQITMEKSPTYFLSKFAAERIKALDANIKLIFIVKEPVERILSHIAMFNDLGKNDSNLSVENTVFAKSADRSNKTVDGDATVITISDYQLHIRSWLDHFRREQILFIDGDEMVRYPLGELKKVEQFLDIKPFFNRSMFKYNESKGKYCFVNGKDSESECLRKGKGREHPKINAETRKLLQEYFAPKNEQFFRLVNRTFDW